MVVQLPLPTEPPLAFIAVVEQDLALRLDIFLPVDNLFPQMGFRVL